MGLRELKSALAEMSEMADAFEAKARIQEDADSQSGVFIRLPDVAPKSATRVINAEARDEKGQLISLGEYGGTATVEELRAKEQDAILSTRQVIAKVVAIQKDSLTAQAKLFRK